MRNIVTGLQTDVEECCIINLRELEAVYETGGTF